MTSARRLKTFLMPLGLVLAILLGLICPQPTLAAKLAQWIDPATGLALGGYDPVAYFTHNAPRRGASEYEANWGGRTWRFVNSGNRDAFIRSPAVYAPQFSGFDSYAITQSRSTRGHPAIWAIRDNKLYLFFSPANRALWLQDPDGAVRQAEGVWQELKRSIPGHVALGEPSLRKP